jgi:hypothetical protein
MTNMTDLIQKIGDVRTNPANIQRAVLTSLEEALGGNYDVVDPSNPFVFLLESSCATSAVSIQRSEALLRKQYASLAQDEKDLYHHMTDVDYVNRFAVPSRVSMTMLMSLDEIHEKAIEAGNGVRKMVIPKDTVFEVESMSFTLHYPIEIRVMPHGGVQLVYDADVKNPLRELDSNLLEWEIVRTPIGEGEVNDMKFIMFEIPVDQFKIEDHYDQLNQSSGYTKTFPFSDQFYYGRVYLATGPGGEWQEIHTTHSEQVYDPNKPTALLTLLDGQLRVHIPQIYFTNNLVGRGIRIDVYTTKGQVELSLGRYQPSSFKASWKDLSKNESPFVAPIRSFSTMTMFSTDRVRGGRNALSFEDLRARVIDNALGPVQIPITESQLTARLDNLGYDIIKDVDNITNRIYLASRTLPDPSIQEVSSATACNVSTLQASADELAKLDDVYDNEIRMTMKAGMLFEVNQGIVSPLNDNLKSQILEANPESRVQLIDERRLSYAPFHYVMDMTEDVFDLRAYDFSRAQIKSKTFIEENESLRLEVATMRYGITQNDDGFKISIVTRSGVVFRGLDDDQVKVQLSYVPDGDIDRAYLNGSLVGRTDDDEYIFEFNLDSSFDVDRQDRLLLTSFKMFDLEPRKTATPLNTRFDLFFIVENYNVDGAEFSELDNRKGAYLLDESSRVVIQESLNVEFGRALEGLWSRARTVAGSQDYLRYENDVMAYYENDVYRRDENNLIVIDYDSESGDVTYQIEHRAGDPVLDGDGEHVVRHYAGDVKLDLEGNPITIAGRTLLRQMDLLLFEGAFAFVTDQRTQRVAEEAREVISTWVHEDIGALASQLLENTRLWFYPQTTFGDVDALVEEASPTSLDANQSFRVKFYLSRLGYDNADLRGDLTDTAISEISSALKRTRISVGEIATRIRENSSAEVYDVVVSGLGGDAEHEMVTLKDASSRLGIRKRLMVLPDNTITVQDDVTIEFVRHTE